MKITLATQRDVPAIVVINSRLVLPNREPDSFYWTQKGWISEQVEGEKMYVVEDRDEICSAMCLKEELLDKLEIETLAVKEGMDRSGFGRVLVNFAIEEARNRDKSQLVVRSLKDFNARGFYERCGFSVSEVGFCYIGRMFFK